MKTRLFISLLVVAMGVMAFSGCQKRSSCKGGIQGHLEVLDEPYKTDSYFYEKNVEITAHFYVSDSNCYSITDKVPNNISKNTLVTAKIHSVYPKEREIYRTEACKWIYKLDCICIDEE